MKTTRLLPLFLLLAAPLLADAPVALSLPPGATPVQARMAREYFEQSPWRARHDVSFLDSGDASFLLAKVGKVYVVGDAAGRPVCEIFWQDRVQQIVSIKRVGDALRVEYTTKGKPCSVSTPVFGLPEGVQVCMRLEGTLSKKSGHSYEPLVSRSARSTSPSGRYKLEEHWEVDSKTGALERYTSKFEEVDRSTNFWHTSPSGYCDYGTHGGESHWYRCGGYDVLVQVMAKAGGCTELQVLRMGTDHKPLIVFSGEWVEPQDADPASLHWSHTARNIGKGVLDLKLQWRTRNGTASSKDVSLHILSPERSEPYYDQQKN